MRRYYRKHSTYRDSDLTLKYLGYWTDNGRKHVTRIFVNFSKFVSNALHHPCNVRLLDAMLSLIPLSLLKKIIPFKDYPFQILSLSKIIPLEDYRFLTLLQSQYPPLSPSLSLPRPSVRSPFLPTYLPPFIVVSLFLLPHFLPPYLSPFFLPIPSQSFVSLPIYLHIPLSIHPYLLPHAFCLFSHYFHTPIYFSSPCSS